jgi:hypothetical protein
MDLKDIVNFLRSENSYPSFKNGTRDPELLGEYSPFGNTVSIKNGLTGEKFNSVKTHELAHALATKVRNEADNALYNPLVGNVERTQLQDGVNKLWNNQFPSSIQEDYYRNNPQESFAFGVSNTLNPNNKTLPSKNPHQDPTRSTELAVLLDLANRTRESSAQNKLRSFFGFKE